MIYTELPPEERARYRAVYEAAWSAGSGRPWLISDDLELITFVDAVAEDWFCSMETMQIAARLSDPLLAPEEVPGWLRDQIARLETAPLGKERMQ